MRFPLIMRHGAERMSIIACDLRPLKETADNLLAFTSHHRRTIPRLSLHGKPHDQPCRARTDLAKSHQGRVPHIYSHGRGQRSARATFARLVGAMVAE